MLLALISLIIISGLLPVLGWVSVERSIGKPSLRHRMLLPRRSVTCYPTPTTSASSAYSSRRATPSALFGIQEWRDLDFGFPGTSADRRWGVEQEATPKEICVLPFPFQDVLLQGQTKELRLYEDRFIDLFEDCMKNHAGVLAMGLMAPAGIVQTVPLCEIEAYHRMEGFGIFVTIRAVARASLLEITREEPYIKAVCLEKADKIPPNLELPNLMASNIESMMVLLSLMEYRLELAKLINKRNTASSTLIEAANTTDMKDPDLRRRIDIARLYDTETGIEEDGIRYDLGDAETDEDNLLDQTDDEDEDNEEDEEDIISDRRGRYREAFQVALATDTQGYRLAASATGKDHNAQELTAISWAAYCTESKAEADAAYRIQAMDTDNLFDRLKLAMQLLRQKRVQLRAKLERAGVKLNSDDPEQGDDASSQT